MRSLVLTLIIAGGVLPILGVALGFYQVIRERRLLATKLDAVEALAYEMNDDPGQWEIEAAKILRPEFTGSKLVYTPHLIRRAILDKAVQDLWLALLITGTGVLCGTAGSAIALYL